MQHQHILIFKDDKDDEIDVPKASATGSGPSSVTYNGETHVACSTCGYVPRQDPHTKSGWMNKCIALQVAYERQDYGLVEKLFERSLRLITFAVLHIVFFSQWLIITKLASLSNSCCL